MTLVSKINKLKETKANIKQSLINKGVADVTDVFSTYPSLIDSIQTGGGTGVGDLDFTRANYSTTPSHLVDGLNYAEEIKNAWDPSNTSFPELDKNRLVFLPTIDTPNVISGSYFFQDCYKLQVVDLPRTENITDMSYMFSACHSLVSANLPHTEACTNMNSMFYRCSSLTDFTLDDTSKVTDMSYMFNVCHSLVSANLPHTEACTDMSYMFYNCSSLTDFTLGDTSKVTDMNSMFQSCSSLVSANIPHTEACTDMSYMFYNCSSLTDFTLGDTSKVTDMSYMLYYCQKLKSVNLPHTEACTDMNWMFYGCNELISVSIGDISQVTDTSYMFSDCYKLNNITLGGNPANITNMSDMFTGLPEVGILHYDRRYDYSQIIALLPSGWKTGGAYKPTACTQLTITADDIEGYQTKTTIHYKAVTTGIDEFTGEPWSEPVSFEGDVEYEVGENPSYDASRQVEVSYTYLGTTATTTITQTANQNAFITPEPNYHWVPSSVETPDASLYSPVIQSTSKASIYKDVTTISFMGVPNFELYLRMSEPDEGIYVGNLDETNLDDIFSSPNYHLTEANTGTDLASYTKVSFPNDGGAHTITLFLFKGYYHNESVAYLFYKVPEKINNSQYTVNIKDTSHGTIEVKGNGTTIQPGTKLKYGTVIDLIAHPDKGYGATDFISNGQVVHNKFIITSDILISTVFEFGAGYGKSELDPNSAGADKAIEQRFLTEFRTTGATSNINYTNDAPVPGGKNYVHYTDEKLVVKPGETVTIHIKGFEANDGLKYCNMKTWVDWNCTGEFKHEGPRPGFSFPDYWEAPGLIEDIQGELVWAAGNDARGFTLFESGYDFNITVPADAQPGLSRLRMVFINAWDIREFGPTGLRNKGYTIDIDVDIQSTQPKNVTITPGPRSRGLEYIDGQSAINFDSPLTVQAGTPVEFRVFHTIYNNMQYGSSAFYTNYYQAPRCVTLNGNEVEGEFTGGSIGPTIYNLTFNEDTELNIEWEVLEPAYKSCYNASWDHSDFYNDANNYLWLQALDITGTGVTQEVHYINSAPIPGGKNYVHITEPLRVKRGSTIDIHQLPAPGKDDVSTGSEFRRTLLTIFADLHCDGRFINKDKEPKPVDKWPIALPNSWTNLASPDGEVIWVEGCNERNGEHYDFRREYTMHVPIPLDAQAGRSMLRFIYNLRYPTFSVPCEGLEGVLVMDIDMEILPETSQS